MMKRCMTMMAVVAALALPLNAHAGGGTGYYEWFLSFNDTLDQPTGPDPSGIVSIYLWFSQGCNPALEGAGMSAAEFKAFANGPWAILAFNTANGFLNAGGPEDLLLAVGGCPTGPVVAGSFLVNASGAGGMRLGPSSLGGARTVDCATNPTAWDWPTFVRFRGCQSTGSATAIQDWGNGCTVDAVEENSWGSIKSLYR